MPRPAEKESGGSGIKTLCVFILEFCGAKLHFRKRAGVFMERGGAASKRASPGAPVPVFGGYALPLLILLTLLNILFFYADY
jgi:predicted membrane protein